MRRGVYALVDERLVARVREYTEVIHSPVWTANTSPLCEDAVANATFRPIEPANGLVSGR